MTDRSQAPGFKTIEQIEALRPKIYNLPNGVPVYMMPQEGQELVKAIFLFPAGQYYTLSPVLPYFTNSLMKEGTSTFSAEKIAELFDFYSTSFVNAINKDNAFFSFMTTGKSLPNILPVVAEILRAPLFPENEIHFAREQQRQKFLLDQEKVKTLARDGFYRNLFGDRHPYGTKPGHADYDNIERDKIVHFFNRNYHPGLGKVVLAGKIDDFLLDWLESTLGKENGSRDMPGNAEYPIQNGAPGKTHIPKKDAVQTAIRVGKIMFNREHPDYPVMQLLNTVLGGYFGSRLMKKIREEKGYTYGIGSGLLPFKEVGVFTINTEVGGQYKNQALNDIYQEIKKLRDQPIPREELDLVKNYMLGNLLKNFDGLFARADVLQLMVEHGLDLNYFDKFVNEINVAQPVKLQEMANKYLDPADLTEITAGQGGT